jgi:hypothetical protein
MLTSQMLGYSCVSVRVPLEFGNSCTYIGVSTSHMGFLSDTPCCNLSAEPNSVLDFVYIFNTSAES